MNVAVFGGTGAAGLLFIDAALAAGHTVTALARNTDKLGPNRERLSSVRAELSNAAAISAVLEGAHAVVSLLGPSGNVRDKALSDAMVSITAAMQRRQVRRLIQVSTPSVVDPADGRDFKFSLARRLIKLAVRGAYDEIVAVADVVRRSDRDWTLVRIPFLTDGPKTERLAIGMRGDAGIRLRLSRANLAGFLLRELTDSRFIRKAPLISDG